MSYRVEAWKLTTNVSHSRMSNAFLKHILKTCIFKKRYSFAEANILKIEAIFHRKGTLRN